MKEIREGRIVIWGCLNIVIIFVILSCIFLFSCSGKYERVNPRSVTYRDRVSNTDTSEVWRTAKYELVNVSYDTIAVSSRVRNTLEEYNVKTNLPWEDDKAVDLNDYLRGNNDSTDWNYTEVDEEILEYLESIGIYWDSDRGNWRKR